MHAANISDDRARQRLELRRRRVGGVAHAIELIEIDAEREDVDAIAHARGALAQSLRRHEHEIRLREEPLLARDDPLRAGRARRQVVDAVVDGELRIERVDQVERDRCRQKRPDDGPVKADRAHPAAERPHEQKPIDASRDTRIRERHQERRIDEQIRPLLAKPLRAAPPVPDALPHPRQIARRRRADAGVLDEQDAVALGCERRHDLLVALPDEVPVDRRNADDIATAGLHRWHKGHKGYKGPRGYKGRRVLSFPGAIDGH